MKIFSYLCFAFTGFLSMAQSNVPKKPTDKEMKILEVNTPIELNIQPSSTSSPNDFDFLVGKWNIHNKKLKSRLTNSKEWMEFDATQEMRKVLTGIGNVENINATIDGKPYEGMAVRLFNPKTKLWSIYWADNNSGTMDKPVVGSFEKNIGTFLCRDRFNDRDIIIKFNWDASNPEKPIWSQAFSVDEGKTWEWNWYMYFSRGENNGDSPVSESQPIKVLELRNYFLKPGQREKFIDFFEANYIQSQNAVGSYVLGQYRVKGQDDNFFWIRGFHDMPSRLKALKDFYYGPLWKQTKNIPNSMLLNNDNVYLLRPLNSLNNPTDSLGDFKSSWFAKPKGIAVVDFIISNQKLDKLLQFIRVNYLSILKGSGIDATFWVSEMSSNDFSVLPVFQDKNLLVMISFYENELEYQSKMKKVNENLSEELKNEMSDLVTIHNAMIIYPTKNSLSLLK